MTAPSPNRRRRWFHRYRALFPVMNLCAVALLLLLGVQSGVAGTMMEGFRGRIAPDWLAVILFFMTLVFGLTAALFPFYWIEHWLTAGDRDGRDEAPSEGSMVISLSQLGVDWLVGSVMMTALYGAWSLLPGLWVGPVFLLLVVLSGLNHPLLIEWSMHRIPDQAPCEDRSFCEGLLEVMKPLGVSLAGCREWNDETQDLPVPAPGVILQGRSPVTVYFPGTVHRTWPVRTLIAAATHQLLVKRSGIASWRILLDAALATGLFVIARMAAMIGLGVESILPEQMPIPLAAATLLLVGIRPVSYLINSFWIYRTDRVTVRLLGSISPVVDLIRRTRKLNGDPALLPVWIEAFGFDGPSALRRIRRLRAARILPSK